MTLTLFSFKSARNGFAVSRNNMQTIVCITHVRLFYCCVSSVKKCHLGTSKCHDHDILTLHQAIRLQHFERGNEKALVCIFCAD